MVKLTSFFRLSHRSRCSGYNLQQGHAQIQMCHSSTTSQTIMTIAQPSQSTHSYQFPAPLRHRAPIEPILLFRAIGIAHSRTTHAFCGGLSAEKAYYVQMGCWEGVCSFSTFRTHTHVAKDPHPQIDQTKVARTICIGHTEQIIETPCKETRAVGSSLSLSPVHQVQGQEKVTLAQHSYIFI